MKKSFFRKALTYLLLLSLVVLPFFSVFMVADEVYAAQQTATIILNTSQTTAIERNWRGYNNPLDDAISFMDDEFIDVTKDAKVGWLRFGLGANVYNWKLGEPDDESITQYYPTKFYPFQENRRNVLAKGKETLSDYSEYARRVGAKLIFTLNVFTDTPNDIGDMAKYVKDNNIQVEYWQLGNEPYWWGWDKNQTNKALIFRGVEDYLNKMRFYYDKIKAELPDAKVLIWYHPNPDRNWNIDIKNYPDRFWDGITFHQYFGGVGTTTELALKDMNTAIDNWEYNIGRFKANSWSTAPMVVTEYGPDSSILLDTLYHGIYVTEAVLRAGKYSNIKYMGGFRLYNGLAKPANTNTDEIQDFYQKGLTVDTTDWNFNMYSQSPALALKVADHAINNSSALWTTTTTGGASVYKADGTTMPAIYSQAYKGDNGKNYVVIVNKSDQTHDITINQDGSAVTAAMTKTYVASTNPSIKNTASNPNNLTIVSEATSNPVYIPAYSVVRVEWDARASTVLPTRLTHAKATGSGEVSLKWWPLDGVTSYNVQYGTTPGTYTNTVQVNDAAETTITGLTNGTTYYFAVYPGTSSSVLSNEISVKLATPTAAPALVDVYAKRKGEVAVEWESVPNATGYKVKYGTTSGVYTNTVDAGNESGYKLTGLTTDTEYFVVVSAYNGVGETGNSSQLSATTRNQFPYAPNNLNIKSTGTGSVTLEWEHTPAEFVFDGFEDGAGLWTTRSGSYSILDITRPNTNTTAKLYQAGGSNRDVATRGQNWGDYEVEAKIDMTGTTIGYSGVVGRYNETVNGYYQLIAAHADYSGYNDPNDNKKYFKIQRIINGVVDQQINFAANPEPITANEFVLGLKMDGNKLTALYNGEEVGSVTDTHANAISKGYGGIVARDQTSVFDQFIIRKSNVESGNYVICRKTTNAFPGPGTERGTVSGTTKTFTDTGLVSGTTYYYRVFGTTDNGVNRSFAPSNVIPYTAP